MRTKDVSRIKLSHEAIESAIEGDVIEVVGGSWDGARWQLLEEVEPGEWIVEAVE